MICIVFLCLEVENVHASKDFAQHLAWLVQHINDTDPHRRVFASLIMVQLLGRLSGEQKLQAARQVADAIDASGLMNVESALLDGSVQMVYLSHFLMTTSLISLSSGTYHARHCCQA